MKLFGFEISRTRQKQVPPPALSSPLWPRGFASWFNVIQEPFTGAWQRNMEWRLDNVLTYFALYSCVTLISKDIGKLPVRLMQIDSDGTSRETDNPAFSPVLRKPNHFQTSTQFIEGWVTAKNIHGSAYILKERDLSNKVRAMYVLDPMLVKPLVAPDGSIFYELGTNQLAGLDKSNITVPASEIIHDVNTYFYHPLCGISPITACGLAALQGLNIQNNSAKFFANGSLPGGILTAPALIDDTTAARIKNEWEQNYKGDNVGKIAVLGDGLEYKSMSVTANDAQLIAQLKWTAENICSCFHVPSYMIGVGPPPNYSNIEALNQQYYSQCLQSYINAIESLLDEGLGLTELPGRPYRTEFDLDELLRMDTRNKVQSWSDLVKGGIASPNEARLQFNLDPTTGGDTPYLQQQNFALSDLAKRSEKEDPFAAAGAKPAAPPKPAQQEAEKEPQKMLPPPPLDWSVGACLKGLSDAGA